MADENEIQIINQGGKLVGVDPETGETVPIKINETSIGQANVDDLFTDGVTMYVRSDGDDSDDGVSESTAKETVESALKDAPIHSKIKEFLTINLGDGTFEIDDIERYSIPLFLVGNGKEGTALTPSNGGTFNINESVAYVKDLSIDGTDNSEWVSTITNGAITRLENVDIVGSSDGANGLGVWQSSTCRYNSGIIDVPRRCLQVRRADYLSKDVDYVSGGDDSKLAEIREHSVGILQDSNFVGGAGLLTGIDVEDTSYLQLRGTTTANDLMQLIQARRPGAYGEITGSVDLTDVTWAGRSFDGGSFRGEGTTLESYPQMDSDPNNIRETGGEYYFNTTAGEFRGYDGNEWVVFDTSSQS